VNLREKYTTMEEHSPMSFEEKKKILDDGRLILSVETKSFKGADIFGRSDSYLLADRVFDRTYIHWPNKMTTSPPGPTTTGYDIINHKPFSGINFATQDYMSLCYNPGSIQAAIEALKRYGSHSGGSPLFFGKNPYYIECVNSLKRAFSRIYPDPHASIFSAGWMAGFGVVSSLTTKNDHIIIDELCHNCLKFGARNSFAKIHNIEHLNDDAMCDKIVEIRKQHPNSGIVVVTEGLFSMDSDCGDIDRIQKVCNENKAIFVIDCAHDMFCLGSKGLGNPGEKIKDFSNVVLLGSGSKSLSNNFGWCVSNKDALPVFMGYFAGSFTFSNALAPAVAANVTYNIDLLMSKEGDERRKRSYENVTYIRKRLTDAGFEVIGDPSPVVIVIIGSELKSRAIANMMYDEGIIVNSVEFPACAPGDSRLRLQVQCDHKREHLDAFVDKLVGIIPKVEAYLENDKLTKIIATKIAESMSAPQKL
jgi:glycine C-acetyltransferase